MIASASSRRPRDGFRASFIFSIGRPIYDWLVELSRGLACIIRARSSCRAPLNACRVDVLGPRASTMIASRLMRPARRQVYCFRRRARSPTSAEPIRRQSILRVVAASQSQSAGGERGRANQDRNYISYPSVNPSNMFVINRSARECAGPGAGPRSCGVHARCVNVYGVLHARQQSRH